MKTKLDLNSIYEYAYESAARNKAVAEQKRAIAEYETYRRMEEANSIAEKNVNPLLRGLATFGDIDRSLSSGLVKSLEGAVDLVASGVGLVGGAFSPYFQDQVKDFVATDYTDKLMNASPIEFLRYDELQKYSYLGDGDVGNVVRGIASGVGQMLPNVVLAIATGGGSAAASAASAASKAAQAASLAYTAASAAGNATEDAFADGAGYGRGFGYGIATGLVEAGTEKLFGGVNKAITGAGVIRKSVASTGIKRVVKNALEEGAEEMISEAVNPALRSIYKGSEAFEEYSSPEFAKNVLISGVVGAGAASVYGGTVGHALARHGIGYTGKEADIADSLQEANDLARKRRNLQASDRLTDRQLRAIDTDVLANYRNVERVLQSVDGGRRAQLISKFGLEGVFDANGRILPAVSARLDVNDGSGEGFYSSDKAFSRSSYSAQLYGSEDVIRKDLNAMSDKLVEAYINERAKNGETVDASVAREAIGDLKVFSGEMSEKANSARRSFTKFINTLNNVSDGNISFVILEPNSRFDGTSIGDRIYITSDTLENGHWIETAVEEYTHAAEGSAEYIALAELLNDDTLTVDDGEGGRISLREKGARAVFESGYGIDAEQIDALSRKSRSELTKAERNAVDLFCSELTAHSSAMLFGNEDFVRRVIVSDESLAKKLYSRISDLKNAFSRINDPAARAQHKRIRAAEEVWLSAARSVGSASFIRYMADREEDEGEKAKFRLDGNSGEHITDDINDKKSDNIKITSGMSEEQRAEILRKTKIQLVEFTGDVDDLNGKNVIVLKSSYNAQAGKILRELGEKFGVFKKYENKNVSLDFDYSRGSLKESVHKQGDISTDFYDFAKMLYVFEDVVKNAVPIEVHKDKYKGTARENTNLKQDYVLLGAFRDGDYIVPVEFHLKEMSEASGQENKLYVSITLGKIKIEDKVKVAVSYASSEAQTKDTRLSSAISIPQLLSKVNPEYGNFYKYIPSSLLNDKQNQSKQVAVKDEKYRLAVMRGEDVSDILRDAARSKGYTDDVNWRMDHQAPNSRDGYSNSIDSIDGIYGGDGSIYSSQAAYYYGEGRPYDSRTIAVIRSAKNNPEKMLKIYRAVPNDVKETRVRNGDWVAIVKDYAIEHGESVLDGDYRIIENTVPAKFLFGNGDSINEWGYDNGNEREVYQNTKNNVKTLEVTYDDSGNVIPLSKRFDQSNPDIRFRLKVAFDDDFSPISQRYETSETVLRIKHADDEKQIVLDKVRADARQRVKNEVASETPPPKGMVKTFGESIVYDEEADGVYFSAPVIEEDIWNEPTPVVDDPDFADTKVDDVETKDGDTKDGDTKDGETKDGDNGSLDSAVGDAPYAYLLNQLQLADMDNLELEERNKKINSALSTAGKFKEMSMGAFQNATQFHPEVLKNLQEAIGKIDRKGNVQIGVMRRAIGDLYRWYYSNRKVFGENYSQEIADMMQRLAPHTIEPNSDDKAMIDRVTEEFLKAGFKFPGNPTDTLSNYIALNDFYSKRYLDKLNEARKKENLSPIEIEIDNETKRLLEYYSGRMRIDVYDMTILDKVLRHVMHVVRNYSSVIRKGKRVAAQPVAERSIEILNETRRINKGTFRNLFANYLYRFADPMSFARFMDGYNSEGFYTTTIDELRKGETNATIMEHNLRKPIEEFLSKHKKFLESCDSHEVSYLDFKLPASKAMALYCTLKRAHAIPGLALSGINYVDEKGTTHRIGGFAKKGDKPRQIALAANKQRLLLEKQFTKDELEFIKVVEKLMNGECRRAKMETDIARQGYSNVSEGYYFTIYRGNIAKDMEDVTAFSPDVTSVNNASFNKNTIKGARGELFITDIFSVVSRHIRGISLYANLSTAIDNFNMLFNLDVSGNPNKPVSIRTASDAYWRNGSEYILKLLEDIKGTKKAQASRDVGERFGSRLRSGFAISALAANPKVLLTQLSSLFASCSILDFDCVMGGFLARPRDVDKYCAVAEVRNSENTAFLARAVIDKVQGVGSALMKPIGWMDRFVINRLFHACQLQVKKDQGIALGTEENKRLAGELLTEVILETQQNATATNRSAAMRSRNELMKTMVMFTSDAMKVAGRVIDAVGSYAVQKREISRLKKEGGDAKIISGLETDLKISGGVLKKSVFALVSSAAFMSLVSLLFSKVIYRSTDDDEEDAEDIAKEFLSGTFGNMIGGLPILSDLYELILSGYDIESASFSVINDLCSDFRKLGNTLLSEKSTAQDYASAIRTMMISTGKLFGIPLRNIEKVLDAMLYWISRPASYTKDSFFKNKSLRSDLAKALEKGDEAMISTISALMLDKSFGAVKNKTVRDEVGRLIRGGHDVLPRAVGDSITYDGETYPLTKRQRERFESVYYRASDELTALITSPLYRSADEEVRAKAIRYVYSLYYNLALEDFLGVELETKNSLFAKAIPINKLAIILSTASSLSADLDKKGSPIAGSKKRKLIAYLQSLKLTAAQKYLLLGYFGYKNSSGKAQVRSYIQSLPLSKSEKQLLFSFSGY